MIQKHRIRTEIGKDQKLTVELKQDYDLLEILSLKFTQQDIYSSLCADYGVVCGRISVNDGFGVANARVSIFIPLTDEDAEDPVVSALYPYKTTTDRNDNNYRYNLLPSRQQHTGHTPTGTFPDQEDILGREEVLEVYEKYYKYTVKTNDSGDFMIWGVPVGSQTLHVDVDLSDMGCQSMVPYDFIYEGTSPEKFENNYTFMASENIDGLPQIVTFEKTIEVYPFWGNEDLCELGITRTDFDLKEQGIRIEPYSVMMGGSFTDSGKDSVRVGCNVDNQMGEKCNLTTGVGDIESIRFTGDYEKNSDGSINYDRPILEAIQLDSQIDEDGNYFFRVPMNMRYVITNEFGETVITTDRDKGIATRGTYRFRMSLQNDNGARKQYRGKYLIPQIKEHQLGTYPNNYTDPKSYAFSTDIDDYPTDAIDDISGVNNNGYSNDYFYSFRYNRVYTVSSFINKYYKSSWAEKVFSFAVKDRNESFIGIKEIQPTQEEDCSNNNEYFPINDGIRNHRFKFQIAILLNTLERIYLIITQWFIDIVIEFLFDVSDVFARIKILKKIFTPLSKRIATYARRIQERTKRELGLINYPTCYECVPDDDGTGNSDSSMGTTFSYVTIDEGNEEQYIIDNSLSPTLTGISTNHSYNVNQTIGTNTDEITITVTSPTGDNTSNYIIKYKLTYDGVNYTYGYLFIGYGTLYTVTDDGTNSGNITFNNVVSKIYEDVLIANNYYEVPYPTSISNTAIATSTSVIIDELYFVSKLTQTLPPSGGTESACTKYDVIYDETATDNGTTLTGGTMALKAFINNGGTQDYDWYKSDPNGLSDYPDVFIDGTEDPCTYTAPTTDIVASVSAYVDEILPIYNFRCRRATIAAGHTWGTASGHSEFRDGVYTLIGAAGKNRELIRNYSRRKLVGKLMCGGITSYSFSNSWLNGALYFFQFRRRRGGSNARYCTDLIYRKEDTNGVHYYYRSTPYYNGSFIGEIGDRTYGEILFPTTIMDLGPRNMYIGEICVDSELDVNCSVSKSIGSTSYQDITNLMEWVISSKEVKEQGRLQASDLFDRREGGGLDGDIVQLLNFNSQVGIYGYDDESGETPYSGTTTFDGAGPLSLNFRFSEDDVDTEVIEKEGQLLRMCINSAGNLTETSQTIPYFRWNKQGDGFGPNGTNSEKQNWDRSTIYDTKYQGGWTYTGLMETDPYNGAGGDPTDLINSYYYDGSILPPIRECSNDNYASTTIPIGGPFFFYFGLRTGKSSWNKFIKNFGPK